MSASITWLIGFRHDRLVHRVDRLVAVPPGSKTVRTVQKVRLVDRLQNPGDPFLHDLVFKSGQSQRPLSSARLWECTPVWRLRLVPLGLQARHQVPQVLLQMLSIFLPSHSINATGPVPAEPMVAVLQKPFVQQMSQARKLAVRLPSSPFRYEGQFRQRPYFQSLCPAYASSSLYALLPTPSSGLCARAGHYPDYASTMSWSDCHTAIPPPCLFSLLEASVGNDMALPSSDANRWITCHGLRPRHGATHSPYRVPRCWLPGHETLGPARR